MHNIKTLSLMAKHFASTDPTRYYINGVFVELRGDHSLYVATNGASILVFKQEGEFQKSGEYIIPRDFLLQFKVGKKEDGKAQIDFADGNVTVHRNGQVFGAKVIDGTFPDWRRVIPSPNGDEAIAEYDPKSILSFQDFAKQIFGRDYVFPWQSGQDPSIVDVGPNCVGVIMPLREKFVNKNGWVERFWE